VTGRRSRLEHIDSNGNSNSAICIAPPARRPRVHQSQKISAGRTFSPNICPNSTQMLFSDDISTATCRVLTYSIHDVPNINTSVSGQPSDRRAETCAVRVGALSHADHPPPRKAHSIPCSNAPVFPRVDFLDHEKTGIDRRTDGQTDTRLMLYAFCYRSAQRHKHKKQTVLQAELRFVATP